MRLSSSSIWSSAIVLAQVLGKGLGVLAQVEGQLGVIIEGVFLDIGLVVQGRCIPEGMHGGHLVVQLDIAEAHLVGGYLAQGIGPLPHLEEALHGALPVVGEVGDFTGAEVVRAVLDALSDAFLIVLPGLVHIAPHQIALAEDAAQAGTAVFGNLRHHLFPVGNHVVVVLLVEAAFEDIVERRLLETVVLLALVKPFFGLREAAPGVMDITQGEGRRGRVVRIKLRGGFQRGHGGIPVSVAVGRIPQLVAVFRQLGLAQMGGIDGPQLGGSLLVLSFVKEVLSPEEAHLGHQGVLMVFLHEGIGLDARPLAFELEGAQGPVCLGRGRFVLLQGLDGLCIETPVV